MDYTVAAALCVTVMLVLLMSGVPIAYALGFSSVAIGLLAFGGIVLNKVGWTTFHLLYNLNWTPLPLFTLMAYVIAETTIGEDLYRAARSWLSRVPGGLIAASIMGEAGMAAALGASAPTIVAVGKVAEPEFERYGYNKPLALGGLTCGGVLGPLIPPSATMIIYAILSNVPLGRLFIAGIIPGVILHAGGGARNTLHTKSVARSCGRWSQMVGSIRVAEECLAHSGGDVFCPWLYLLWYCHADRSRRRRLFCCHGHCCRLLSSQS
jgi:C4-dicarboxylate transporter DctM subunit